MSKDHILFTSGVASNKSRTIQYNLKYYEEHDNTYYYISKNVKT